MKSINSQETFWAEEINEKIIIQEICKYYKILFSTIHRLIHKVQQKIINYFQNSIIQQKLENN